MSLRSNNFAGKVAPRSLNRLGSRSQEANPGARECIHEMHQRGGHTQVPRRSRNGQARVGVGAGLCDAMQSA